MSTEKIREELEKIRALSALQKDYLKLDDAKSEKDLRLIKAKIAIARDEMLKSTYSIGRLLKHIEEKV